MSDVFLVKGFLREILILIQENNYDICNFRVHVNYHERNVRLR